MSKVDGTGFRWALQRRPREVCGWRLEADSWIHQIFLDRLEQNRDLKIVITASDAQTGVGKSTLAFTLAASWHPIYTGEPWSAADCATYDVAEFLRQYTDQSPGSVLLMEEAEQLDARRSMAGENVDFSHYWMAMRVRQMVSILTLPSTTALDKRLWELSDVWINVEARGEANVYECQINDFPAELWRQPKEKLYWPDTSEHPEMKALDTMKEEKIDRGLSDIETDDGDDVDADDVRREEKISIAQTLRNSSHLDLTGEEIGDIVGRSDAWVYNNTKPPNDAAN